jgi:hypothetical protein
MSVVSLLIAAMFSAPRIESAAYLRSIALPTDAPTNLVVSATSNASISLSWTAPATSVTSYQVERSDNVFGTFVFVGSASGTTFNDTTVTTLRAYLYRVRAVLTDGCQSYPSNIALGTAISFEFSQLQNQPVKARHLNDVRTATNAVRAVANLPQANWTRSPLDGLTIQASDVQELRNRLTEALTALDIPVDSYQDPILSTGANGTPIKAIHIEQLQTRSTRGVRTNPFPLETSSNRSQVGEFGPIIALPLVAVHLSVLPDGRVLFWGRDKNIAADGSVKEIAGKSEAYVWNIPDGSNKTDVAIFRPSENKWYINNSSNGATQIIPWGLSGDVPEPGDYDGDGRADIAIFRPSNGLWGIVNSSNGTTTSIGYGVPGDIPVPADYDQDGKTDLAVFRPSENTWYIRKSSDGSNLIQQWGTSGDVPVPGDYDRDRKTDFAVFRPSENKWYIRKSSDGSNLVKQWGMSGDVPAPGDYNGDGTTDLAVYRPSDGNWYVLNIIAVPETSQTLFVGQASSFSVVPGDYDGDGKTDPAIFRSSEGNWQIRNSSDGSVQIKSWGQSGDVPVAKDYDGMLRVANSTTNLFCSGHSFLPDGRLLVAGGHQSPDQDGVGEPHTNLFDFRTNSWVRGPEMNKGRWYPYNVALNNGETLIISGADTPNTINNVPQIYGSCLRDLNSPSDGLIFTTYPFLHLMPDGKVLMVQSGRITSTQVDKRSRVLDPFAVPPPTPTNPNPKPGVWSDYPSTINDHWTGSSVLFDSGHKVLVMGGFDGTQTPTSSAEFIDVTPPPPGQPTPTPAWKTVIPMNFPRTYHTATILPDGKVLVTGGVRCHGAINIDCGTVLNAEMWDPTSNPSCLAQIPWRVMARQTDVRAYHSTAVLLPDGRVLVAGGGLPGGVGETDLNGKLIEGVLDDNARMFGHKNVEIYSPPYLFDVNGNLAAQPTITSWPTSILYGQTFSVGTSGAGSAPKVSVVRLPSVTHGFNQDQRHLFLNVTAVSSSAISVTAPAANECPPGYYMLFVLNNGVPSIARIVRVGNMSMFPTDVPATTASGGGSAFEQGLEFSSSVSGQITHIRFWKAPDEPAGNHVGRVWTATGTPLASAIFSCESASGWQEVQLATPVQITAGVRYRVTYNVQNVVAKTFNVLDSPITRGPLTAWSSYFIAGAGNFPTTPSGSNLFADFVFKQ